MSAANTFTTTDLVSNVQLLAHMPLGNNTFTATEIIRLADREIKTSLMRQILSVREGYYRTFVDYSIVSSGQYAVPGDAIAGALDNIEVVQGQTIVEVNRIDESEQNQTDTPSSTTYGYFISGNTIQILPTSIEGVVRVWYMRRPSALVATSAAAQITGISGAVITVASLPATIVTSQSIDACQDQPTFEMLGTRTVSGISGLNVTVSSAVTGLAVGDWLALQNQTPVPQIPVEFRPLLEQRVVVKIYELQGYLDKMKAAQMKLQELENDLFSLISPRTQSKSKVIAPTNGGVFSGNRRWRAFPMR